MTLTIPEEIAQAAHALSQSTGIAPERLLLRALQAHFPPVPPELQAEFDAWELASDEDMAKMNVQAGLH